MGAEFRPAGLEGVGAEEVERRREQYAQRLAGCPLEQWLARRRPVGKAGCGAGSGQAFCSCRCHAVKPLTGAVRERHERKKAA